MRFIRSVTAATTVLGGTGDFGTDNFWEDNLGSGSPAGICTEP
jgi:hypothetical protein